MGMFLALISLILTGCSTEVIEAETLAGEMKNPNNPTGWSQSGTLRVRDSRNSGVGLQAEFPVLGNYTVQFNIAPVAYTTGGGIPSHSTARAEITWSVKGNFVRRVISVVDGSSITGTAEAVNVRLLDDSGPLPDPGEPRDYLGSIQVAYGTRGSNKQPPFLFVATTSVDPGMSTIVPIPNDVGANSVFVGVGSGLFEVLPDNSVQARLQRGATGNFFYDPRYYDWVPLIGDSGDVELFVAGTVVNPVTFTVVLGIDG